MGLVDLFRRRPAIRDTGALADFIDEHSAFLVQKGIYEYSRARAGPFAKMLMGEPVFLESVEQARWRAYPLGLAMVGEMVEGVLRPHAADPRETLDALARLVLAVFDRYPVPAALDEERWRAARQELAHRIDLVGLHPPKRVIDIPEPLAESYFALMPIHEKLRGRDFPTLHSYLRVALCNVHDQLTKRLDTPALAAALRAADTT